MFKTIDLSARAGSEIHADRAGLINGDYSKEIEKLLVERSALVFRELFFTDEEQLQFAKTIGKVVPQGEDGVSKISLDPKVSDNADYTRGAFFWHIDGANDALPAKATMLTAKVLSDEGGDTLISACSSVICRIGPHRTNTSIATSGRSATSCCGTTPAPCTAPTRMRSTVSA